MLVRIFTEAGAESGWGHFSRCLALQQAWRQLGCPVEMLVDGTGDIEALLTRHGGRLCNWRRDYSKLAPADIVVVDSYRSEASLHRYLAERAGLIVFLDDTQRDVYPCGIVLNAALGAEDIPYPARASLRYLLGVRYAPLRQAFWPAEDIRMRPQLSTLLLSFGGSDSRNLTPPLLKMLTERYPALSKIVVVGAGFSNSEAIAAAADNRTTIAFAPDARQMRALMEKADLCIGAGGQTLYELARVGLPTIVVIAADNQWHNARRWEASGFAFIAGPHNIEDLAEHVAAQLRLLEDEKERSRAARAGRRLVDGHGALRVAESCLTEWKERVKL